MIWNKLLRKAALLRGTAKLNLQNGARQLRFVVKTDLEYEKISSGDGEKQLIRLFLGSLRPDDVVYDIGANIGLFTLPIAQRLNGGGRVISFEPISIWARRLRENVSLNGLGNVTVIESGLSSDTRTVPIHFKDVIGSGMATIMQPTIKSGEDYEMHTQQISLAKGDDLIVEKNLPTPTAIKIDVEGAEYEALSGLKNTLTKTCCRIILCEVHPLYLNVPAEKFHELLRGFGYTIEKVSERKSEYHLLAIRNAESIGVPVQIS